MDEHDRSIRRHLGEPRADGRRARLAARHAGRDLRGADLLREQDRRLLPTGRRDDDDRVDRVAIVEPPQRLGEQRQRTEPGERLRSVPAEPVAASRGDEHGPGLARH